MKTTLLSAAVVAATAASPAFAGAVLDKIRANDQLVCGVNTSAPGFSSADSKGHWEGLDVNLCRSVAAAVLGNADKVKYVPLSSTQHMTALASGQIDMLARNTTWTMTRDASHGNVFVAVSYYDGQAFMVPKSLGVKSLKELDGMCPNGHNDRKDYGGLLPFAWHAVQDSRLRYNRGYAGGIPFRSL